MRRVSHVGGVETNPAVTRNAWCGTRPFRRVRGARPEENGRFRATRTLQMVAGKGEIVVPNETLAAR
jgi:hypothetical protein